MSGDETTVPRAGSSQDLSRRMDRLEGNHESLALQVTTLAATVGRVELNQVHATELNKLRFDALDSGITGVGGKLDVFMARINGIMSGEIKLPIAAAGEKLVEDYQAWRSKVDDRLETGERERFGELSRNKGIFETLGVGRGIALFIAAIAGGIVAALDLYQKVHS